MASPLLINQCLFDLNKPEKSRDREFQHDLELAGLKLGRPHGPTQRTEAA